MTNWATIRIRKETKEQAEADKDESETWDEYLRRCNPETQTETEIKVKIEQETRR